MSQQDSAEAASWVVRTTVLPSRLHGAIVAFALILYCSIGLAEGYAIGPIPDWVQPVTAPLSAAPPRHNSSGVMYLLSDRQWRVGKGDRHSYVRLATRALNTLGVEQSSHISIDFDPVFETLTLHEVTIHRDGQVLERLARSQISLIQREQGLEHQIYDGTKTLNIFVDDVRVGDSVEYSYSLHGSNPVFAGHFAASLAVRWQAPVERVHYRVAWGKEAPLQIRNYLTSIEPTVTVSDTYTDYVWSAEKVAELVPDADLPSWYDPFPAVHLSDMVGWNEVAEWAVPLYSPTASSPALDAIVSTILSDAASPTQRVSAALRFVQEGVRYLGIEMGPRSHQPRTPDQVLEQRFGDCKDKSRLLVSLLRNMGIEAVPALVRTDSGKLIEAGLPTPTAFNHVIVHVRLNGEAYWLDPTLSFQGRYIETILQPDYERALLVEDGTTGLVPTLVEGGVVHGKTVQETFDIRNAFERPATYVVETQLRKFFAEEFRGQLAETTPRRLQQAYLNYYARHYPSIQVARDLAVADDLQRNSINLVERYSIPDIWTADDDDTRFLAIRFLPFVIHDHVKDTATLIRTMPLAINHPVDFRQTTRILVPPDSFFENEHHEVVDEAFRFTKDVTFDNGTLQIDYRYTSLQDHVLPDDIQDYSNNVRAVQRLSQFQISIPKPGAISEGIGFDADDANWPIIALAVLSLLITIVLSYRHIYLYDPTLRLGLEADSRLAGIAGWLIFPALGVVLSPLLIAAESRELLGIFSYTHWSIIGDRLGPAFQSLILVELLVNMLLAAVGIYIAVLFFQRRNTLPLFYIAYSLVALVVMAADHLVARLLFDELIDIQPKDTVELMRQGVFTIIWVAYFLRSERVKATFTRRRDRGRVLTSVELS